jgi:predicted DNA-binding transcriptional regulator YafY
MNAPIVWDRALESYRLQKSTGGSGPAYELPGLWFSPSEARALLTLEHLVQGLEPALLGPQVEPLKARLAALLSTGDHSLAEVRQRIRVLPSAARRHAPKHFEAVASAVLERRRLVLTYWNRTRDEETRREISPQRLVHYRDNWYLDAWDHGRGALRTFALDAMRGVAVAEGRARDVSEAELDATLASGYGIFAGRKVRWARLRFTPAAARYVAQEEWHPRQRSRWDPDGGYVLEVPYSSDRELVREVLRHGAEVEVLGPPELYRALRERVQALARLYERKRPATR